MTEQIEVSIAGTISGLGLDVDKYYKLGATNEKTITKEANSLILLDIQYLGNQEIDVFMERLNNPKHNSIFISKESHINKVICGDTIRSKSKSKKITTANLLDDEDCVKKYMKRYQSDELVTYYDDYDSIIESLVSREVFAGSVTKIRRLPVISLYKNKQDLKFIEALADNRGTVIDTDNKANFIVYSDSISTSSPKMYLIAEEKKLEYVTSYIIDPSINKIAKVTGESTLKEYKKNNTSNMVITGCDLVNILEESLKIKI